MTERIRAVALAALVVVSALAVAAPAAAVTGDAELSLAPADGQVATGESVTYGVVADVDGGVGSYDLNVTVEDPGTATITNVSNEIGGTARTRVDGAHARIAAVGGDTVDSGSDVVVATVTVRAEAAGSTGVSLEPASLADESGDRYRATGADGARLDATETAPTIGAGDAPAGDPDGDGVYEDVNGDGEVTPGDATVLVNAIRGGDPAVVTNPEACDVDGDGRVTRGDATALFRSALAG